MDLEVAEGPSTEENHNYGESAFINIKTTYGVLSLTARNEHNGYYGGFDIVVTRD